jgi:hypothetical protein
MQSFVLGLHFLLVQPLVSNRSCQFDLQLVELLLLSFLLLFLDLLFPGLFGCLSGTSLEYTRGKMLSKMGIMGSIRAFLMQLKKKKTLNTEFKVKGRAKRIKDSESREKVDIWGKKNF